MFSFCSLFATIEHKENKDARFISLDDKKIALKTANLADREDIMKNRHGYIMQDQVRGLIPSLMKNRSRNFFNDADTKAHLVSVAAVSSVYVLSVMFSV